jgi:hypothetical protein
MQLEQCGRTLRCHDGSCGQWDLSGLQWDQPLVGAVGVEGGAIGEVWSGPKGRGVIGAVGNVIGAVRSAIGDVGKIGDICS